MEIPVHIKHAREAGLKIPSWIEKIKRTNRREIGGGDSYLESTPPLRGGEGRITKKGIEEQAHGQSSNLPLGRGVNRTAIRRLSVRDQSTGSWVLSKIKTQTSVNEQAAEEEVDLSSSLVRSFN